MKEWTTGASSKLAMPLQRLCGEAASLVTARIRASREGVTIRATTVDGQSKGRVLTSNAEAALALIQQLRLDPAKIEEVEIDIRAGAFVKVIVKSYMDVDDEAAVLTMLQNAAQQGA